MTPLRDRLRKGGRVFSSPCAGSSYMECSISLATTTREVRKKKRCSGEWRSLSLISLKDAKILISLARRVIASVLEGQATPKFSQSGEALSQKAGVFVTLRSYPDKQLRGCVGLPTPDLPLWEAVIHSALSSAFRDPRFSPIKREELDRITIELSVLTPPKEVPKESLPDSIKVGRDGLIIELAGRKGLLLPQVAVEYGWSPEEFLSRTCEKAGLDRDCWRWKDTKVFTFQAEVFEEKEPCGEVLKS